MTIQLYHQMTSQYSVQTVILTGLHSGGLFLARIMCVALCAVLSFWKTKLSDTNSRMIGKTAFVL